MGLFEKGKKDSKEIQAKNDIKKSKTRMEDFQDKVSVPLHLSLPFYVISVFALLAGIFIVVHWGIGSFLADETGRGFLTTLRKEFALQANMNDVRWKYYIPMRVFNGSLMNGIYMFLFGFVFIVLNKIGTKSYAKKRVREALEEKR